MLLRGGPYLPLLVVGLLSLLSVIMLKVYPTDFTILTAPDRLRQVGDLWAGILDAKHDLKGLLERSGA